jgi:hypothetical protein
MGECGGRRDEEEGRRQESVDETRESRARQGRAWARSVMIACQHRRLLWTPFASASHPRFSAKIEDTL